MPANYGLNDSYARPRELLQLRQMLETHELTAPQLAFELRLSVSHMYAMLKGRKKMARHVLLACRFVLLLHRAATKKEAARRLADRLRDKSSLPVVSVAEVAQRRLAYYREHEQD